MSVITPIIYQNLWLVSLPPHIILLSAAIKVRTYLRNRVTHHRNYLHGLTEECVKEYRTHIVNEPHFPQPRTLIIRDTCFLIKTVNSGT